MGVIRVSHWVPGPVEGMAGLCERGQCARGSWRCGFHVLFFSFLAFPFLEVGVDLGVPYGGFGAVVEGSHCCCVDCCVLYCIAPVVFVWVLGLGVVVWR